jgi:hypothetical protein
MVKLGFVLFSLAVLSGCNVSATSHNTGGVGSGADAGATCDKGEIALLTDYTSTQIALTAPDGTVQSASFLSTASTTSSSDAYPLSGDVALPSTRPPSGLVVLLDRYGSNVITWADPASGKVLAQLPVGATFESNPQDYVETDATHALVSRYGVNASPGKAPFDTGSDVIVIDTKAQAITASIPMPATNGLPPSPAGMIQLGTTTLVMLQNLSTDFTTMADSVVVGIQAGAVAWQMTVAGLKGCNRFALSPSGKTLALSCEGEIDANGNVENLAESAVVTYDVTSLPPKLVKEFAISDQLQHPTQDRVSFVSETVLVGKTQTPLGGTANNQAFSLDTSTGKATVLLTANPDATGKGKGIVYGDFLCSPGCGNTCILADSDVGKLQRWQIGASGALTLLAAIDVDPTVGLPPVSVAGY